MVLKIFLWWKYLKWFLVAFWNIWYIIAIYSWPTQWLIFFSLCVDSLSELQQISQNTKSSIRTLCIDSYWYSLTNFSLVSLPWSWQLLSHHSILNCREVHTWCSTYEWELMVLVFLCLAYFTSHDFQSYLCCCKIQNSILLYWAIFCF